MVTAPEAVVDALNALLESQQNSIIRFMGEGSPYLTRATVELRGTLAGMLANNRRRCAELYHMVEDLGGSPRPLGLQPEEQYLAFLSLKFLLPKIVEAKGLIIRRYENATRAVGEAAPQPVRDLLGRHLGQHRAELQTLQQANAQVLAAK